MRPEELQLLNQRLQLLQPQHFRELLSFLDTLLYKQQQVSKISINKPNHQLLHDLESIPIPVDGVTINRNDLYNDRI